MVRKLVIGLLVLFFASTPALAVEVGGVEIPDTQVTDAGDLVLNGAGIRKKFGFKVYIGALYLKEKSSDAQKIIDADEPMSIVMTWKRNGPVNKVNPVYAEGFKYMGDTGSAALKADIDTFLGLTVKASKGDIWTYRYLPGTGVNILFNGEPIKTIPGLEFKRALFAIWLHKGDNFTGDKRLRAGMLGE